MTPAEQALLDAALKMETHNSDSTLAVSNAVFEVKRERFTGERRLAAVAAKRQEIRAQRTLAKLDVPDCLCLEIYREAVKLEGES